MLPIVFEKNGTVFANSRDVAAFFGKEHKHVLRDINELCKATGPNMDWFNNASYLDAKGEARPSFDMSRDGFTLLVMGYTGAKAMQFKLAYINAFNEMERTIKAAMPAIPNFANPAEAARAWADQYEQRIEAEKTLAIAAPKAEKYDEIGVADGLMCLTDAGKIMGMSQKVFFSWMKIQGMIYKRGNKWHPYQTAVNDGILKEIVTTSNGKAYTQCRVTTYGLTKLQDMYRAN